MYEIIPHLYISNYEDAKKVPDDFFVINCTYDLPMIKTSGGCVRFNIKKIDIAINFINYYLTRERNVLVYSLAGQQRSGIVVAAYLIKFVKLTVDEAINFLKPYAFSNGVYYRTLLEDFYISSNSL